MSRCPICKNMKTTPVALIREEGTPHHAEGHNFQYNTVRLYACPNCHHGHFEIYDHDCYPTSDHEPWDMYWYAVLTPEGLKAIQNYLAPCQTPSDNLSDGSPLERIRKQLSNITLGSSGSYKTPASFAWLQIKIIEGELSIENDHEKGFEEIK